MVLVDPIKQLLDSSQPMYLEMAIKCAYLELKTTKHLIAPRKYAYRRLDRKPKSFLGAAPAIRRIQTNAGTDFRETRPVYSCV